MNNRQKKTIKESDIFTTDGEISASKIRILAKKFWVRTFYHSKGIGLTSKMLKLTDKTLLKRIDEINVYRERRIGYSKHMDWKLLKNKVMLDFGCGSAPDSHYIVKNIGVKHLTIADIVPQNIELAKRHLSQITDNLTTFLWDTPTDLKKLGMFDIIYSNGVLMTMPDEKIIVNELKKHLRKDGYFIIMLYTLKFKPNIIVSLKQPDLKNLAEGIYTRGHSLQHVKKLFGDDMKVIRTKTFREDWYRRFTIKWK